MYVALPIHNVVIGQISFGDNRLHFNLTINDKHVFTEKLREAIDRHIHSR